MQTNILDSTSINKLVVSFYTKVLDDEKLAPFFIAHLGEDLNSHRWQGHMLLLTQFWSSMMIGTGEYRGFPFPPHATMGLDRQAFEAWIKLFFETSDEVFTEDIAIRFKEKGSIIAGNFMRKLGI